MCFGLFNDHHGNVAASRPGTHDCSMLPLTCPAACSPMPPHLVALRSSEGPWVAQGPGACIPGDVRGQT